MSARATALVWVDTSDNIDWHELSELYRVAPLAYKEPELLRIAFSNSMFKRFAFEDGKLVAAGRGLGRQIVSDLLNRVRRPTT